VASQDYGGIRNSCASAINLKNKNKFPFFLVYFQSISYLCKQNRELCRFDRDTHQITLKTELTSLANGGPQHVHKYASRKAGGLQRRRVLKSFNKGVFITSPGGTLFFYYF
jgi:hypothetical protein